MSMTDLKEARWTLSHLEEAGCPLETTDMRGYWRGRVAELEAAEKETKEPHMTIWETLNSANVKIERLERKVEEDCSAQNMQYATIRKWCCLHNHDIAPGASARTSVPCDVSKL